MIKSDKKLKELTAILSNDNSLVISEAIGMLRDEEPFEGAITLLASFYDRTEDRFAKKTIADFMNDIKDQSVTSEIISEIRKPYKPATISMLISSCWQSGLNYSGYSNELVDIFLKSDYVTALECFTVIEESAHQLTRKRKNEIINTIDSYPLSPGNDKSGLMQELKSILK